MAAHSPIWRLVLGILAAGLAATATGVPAATVLALLRGHGADDAAVLWDVWTASLLLLPVGLMLTLLGGLPVHLALVWLRRTGPVAYGLGGAVAGAAVLSLVLQLGGEAMRPMLLGAAMGLAAGLAFRAVWRPMAW